MSIRVDDIVKRFGNFAALNGVSLEARPGEFLALLGPSGSGKTTLLRIMAGLEFPDGGSVSFDTVDVTGLAVRDRGVGFVFQHYALFRHMSVLDNVAFGLRVKRRALRLGGAEIKRRAHELLELVQLRDLGDRLPSQLSGGQRQRVALARALAVDPKLLLLDEPFGALDARVRKDLRRWLRDLHDRMGLTSIFVTHDQEEALELADRVVVMNHGRIVQVATPELIYDRPATPFVFDFVGESNRLPVRFEGRRIWFENRLLEAPAEAAGQGEADLFFRPQDADIVAERPGTLPLRVTAVRRRGGTTRIEGIIAGCARPLEIFAGADSAPTAGGVIHLSVRKASLFPRERQAI